MPLSNDIKQAALIGLRHRREELKSQIAELERELLRSQDGQPAARKKRRRLSAAARRRIAAAQRRRWAEPARHASLRPQWIDAPRSTVPPDRRLRATTPVRCTDQ